MKIEYKKLLKGYLVTYKGALIACDKNREIATAKALSRIVYKKQ